jgi:hypothetical protein
MKQSTYLVQRPQANKVRSFVLSVYLGVVNRVGWPIQWSSSLNDLVCGFVLPALRPEWRIAHGWAVEIE